MAALEPLLPIEVCEKIIDHYHIDISSFPDERSLEESYPHLLACCLTCRAWRTRSRLRLYSIVVLRRYQDVDRLLQAITLNPSLASIPYALWITHVNTTSQIDCYIPFANPNLVQALPNVRVLLLNNVYRKHYPPRYHLLASRLPIIELRISTAIPQLNDFFPLVWALNGLKYLYMCSPAVGQGPSPSDSECLRIEKLSSQRARCTGLRRLELDVSSFICMCCRLDFAEPSFYPTGLPGSINELPAETGFRGFNNGVDSAMGPRTLVVWRQQLGTF